MTIIYDKKSGRHRRMTLSEISERKKFCNKNAGKLTLTAIALAGGIFGWMNKDSIKTSVDNYIEQKIEAYVAENIERVKPYIESTTKIPAEPGRGSIFYVDKLINENPNMQRLIQEGKINKSALADYIEHLNSKGFFKDNYATIPDKIKDSEKI